jgi:hypothetical protein
MHNHNCETRSYRHFYRGKAEGIAYSECVSVALVNQCAMRMSHIVLSTVACQTAPYFSTLFKQGTFFKKYILDIKCVS